MKRTFKSVVTLVTVLLLVLVAACVPAPAEITPAPTPTPEPTPTPTPTPTLTPTPTVERGTIEIRVTDPPAPELSSIEVFIDPVEGIKVHKVVPGESGEWIDVPLVVSSFDLVKLVGVTETLGAVETEAGSFTQIRIAVEAVKVNGETATLPSDTLKIVRPFEVGEGLTTTLELDFDGEKSVVTTGRGRFIFKPVVRLLVERSSPPAEGADTTPPVITLTGVTEGQVIVSPNTVTPVFSASDDTDPEPALTATLNGEPFTSGTVVSEVGEYELVVTAIDASDNEAEVAVNFEIVQE